MTTAVLAHTFTGSETYAPFASGVLPAFTGTFTIHAVRTGANSNSMNVDVKFFNSSSTVCWQQSITWTAGTADHGIQTFVVGTPSANWACGDWTGWSMQYDNLQFTPQATGSSITLTLDYTPLTPPGACAYGAEPNPAAAVYTYITETLVEAVAVALGMGPLGVIALGVMIGAPIIFPVCDHPPAMPAALTNADFVDGTALPNPLTLNKWKDHFVYGVWLFYCQCKPAPSGQPAPTQPPKPPVPPRVGPGPQPVQPCDNADICTTLRNITNILTTINLSITNNNYVQTEPAYTWGALYAGISGNGEIAVSGILGVFVSFSTLPNRVGGSVGDPNTIWDAGFIDYGSDDGWYPRQRITSNPWLSLPLHMTNISRVGYSIPADCVVAIHLLVAVPMALAAAPGT